MEREERRGEERRGSYHVIGFQAVLAVLTGSQATGAPVQDSGSSPGELRAVQAESTTSTTTTAPGHYHGTTPQQLMTYRSLFVAACGLHAWISFGLSREITILG